MRVTVCYKHQGFLTVGIMLHYQGTSHTTAYTSKFNSISGKHWSIHPTTQNWPPPTSISWGLQGSTFLQDTATQMICAMHGKD